jgi:hypothetical protein
VKNVFIYFCVLRKIVITIKKIKQKFVNNNVIITPLDNDAIRNVIITPLDSDAIRSSSSEVKIKKWHVILSNLKYTTEML